MKHRRLRWLAGLVATFALLGATILPAHAGPTNTGTTSATYAALGDSFAAGWGAGVPINQFGQSAQAHPVLLAGGPDNLTFTAQALGVTTETVLAQVSSIPTTAKQVTLTVGGNDLDFVGTVAGCLDGSCDLSGALAKLPAVKKGVAQAIAAIKAQAPKAKIYVTGYPLLFQPRASQCVLGTLGAGPLVVPSSVALKLDLATLALNATIQSATRGSKSVEYVDVTFRFLGHGVCGTGDTPNPRTWLNPVVPPTDPTVVTWLHPTASGQEAYAAAIRSAGFGKSPSRWR